MQIRVGGILGLVLALVIGGFVFYEVRSVTDSANKTANAALAQAGISGDLGSVNATANVKAGDAKSLYKSANLKKALAAAGGAVGPTGKVSDIKVEPGRVILIGQVDGKLTTVMVNADDAVSKIAMSASAGNAISLARVDAAGVDRMVAAAQAKGVAPDQIRYLVVDAGIDADTAPSWLLYTPTGHMEGDIHGKNVKVIS